MDSPTRDLARFVRQLRFGEWPNGVTQQAKLCIADALACCLGAHGLPWHHAAAKWVTRMGGKPESTIWGYSERAMAHEAAFVNGVGAHSILQEDFHPPSHCHPGSVVVPAALAVAETVEATGEQLLTAVVAGYEAMLRVGMALHTHQFAATGLRPSGMFGAFGSTAAAGVLLDLNEEQLVAAFGLAGNMAAGLRQWGAEGTTDVFFHNGNAARNGVMAAYLARDGVTGPEHVLEGRGGLGPSVSGVDCNYGKIGRQPGESWEIEAVDFKSVPACAGVQTVAQLALRIAEDMDLDPSDVSEGVIYTSHHGKNTPGNDYAGPFNRLSQAQMSNQFSAAVAMVDRDLSFDAYRRFDRPEIAQLAERFKVEVDPVIEKLHHVRAEARIELRLRNGKEITYTQADTILPDDAAIYAKLRGFGQALCGTAAGLNLEQMAANLEQLSHVKELATAAVPRHDR